MSKFKYKFYNSLYKIFELKPKESINTMVVSDKTEEILLRTAPPKVIKKDIYSENKKNNKKNNYKVNIKSNSFNNRYHR